MADRPIVASRAAEVYAVFPNNRDRCIELPRLAVGADHVPDHVAGFGVQRHDMSIDQAPEHPALGIGHPAPEPSGPGIFEFVGAGPPLLSCARVDRISPLARREVHRPRDDHRIALEAHRLRELEASHFPERRDVLGIDLCERREASGVVAAVERDPLDFLPHAGGARSGGLIAPDYRAPGDKECE